ncbi:MAG: UDP-galactopyranose mutase [Terrimicrobiaceae bacterium]
MPRTLIIGAGFSGLTIAERLTTQLGHRCLLVEKRNHIGGNAYDRYDSAGVLIHHYGPHYFRTNSPKIREYLSQFTEWHPVDYEILSSTKGRYWNFPINLNTFEQFLGHSSTTEEMEAWLAEKRVPIANPANSEEVIVSQVGWELYEMFFKGYTIKQWKRDPKDLDASVCGRIPIRTNRDNRYLREEFQALPKEGYTRLFETMIAACGDNLEIRLNTDYRDVLHEGPFDRIIYTGPIDEFYGCRFGKLPYRSLRFENESFTPEQLQELDAIRPRKSSGVTSPPSAYAEPPTFSGIPRDKPARQARHSSPATPNSSFWQPAMQVNYPNEEAFTRIVEIKHATGQQTPNTTIVREYPEDYGPGKEPYYPIPAPDAAALYQKYKALADSGKMPQELKIHNSNSKISFIGRLATYRYYNMDQVVGMALAEFDRIQNSISKIKN